MIETHQIWIVRTPGLAAPSWCPECARTVRMVTADEAARLLRQNTRTIYNWIEASRLHYRETPVGSLLVCFDSLFAGATDAAHGAAETLRFETESGPTRDYGHET